MFDTSIDKQDIKMIKAFLKSDQCHLIEEMNKAGLSFGAMALVLQGIENICNEVESTLSKEN